MFWRGCVWECRIRFACESPAFCGVSNWLLIRVIQKLEHCCVRCMELHVPLLLGHGSRVFGETRVTRGHSLPPPGADLHWAHSLAFVLGLLEPQRLDAAVTHPFKAWALEIAPTRVTYATSHGPCNTLEPRCRRVPPPPPPPPAPLPPRKSGQTNAPFEPPKSQIWGLFLTRQCLVPSAQQDAAIILYCIVYADDVLLYIPGTREQVKGAMQVLMYRFAMYM